MAEITAKMVKELRDATGAGMMDAKKALTEADGDMEAARQILREKGLAKAESRSDRQNDEGVVAVARSDDAAAIVQLKCETDFSAKSDAFVALAREIAEAVLERGPDAVDEFEDRIDDLRLTIKENIEVGAVERVEAGPGELIDVYVHQQDGRGVNGVIVVGRGVPADDLHQVALHIAFARPVYLSRDEVPADEVERERAALLEITRAEGKPEAAWDKIVEGRLRGWYGQRVLLDQGLHGDKTTVADSLGGGEIVRFVQVVIGS